MGDCTPHFSYSEFEVGSQGAPIPAKWRDRIWLLCWSVLEPVRLKWGRIKITSGYRPSTAISQHSVCEAADIYPQDADRLDVWEWLLKHLEAMPIDQMIIYEPTNHIHLSASYSAARHPLGTTGEGAPRKMVLVGLDDGRDKKGHQKYRYETWENYTGPLKRSLPW